MSDTLNHGISTITLRLPKFNWQITALLLIAVVAGFQTYQLSRLKGAVSVRPAAAAGTVAAPAGGAGSANQGLEGMVGGC